MKDSFSQNERLVNNLNLDCELENIVCNLLEELQYQKENRLQEEYFDEEEFVHTNMTEAVEKIGSTAHTIDEWLKKSIEQDKILLNYQTTYMLDISHHSSTPFNTIVFHSNLYPLKTKETSKKLMKRFIDHKGVPYEKIRSTGRILGFYYKIPYVLGELMFIPEKSLIKGTSSWFALHHVSHYEVIEQSSDIRIYFKGQPTISIVTERLHFLKQVEKGTTLSCYQQLFAKEMLVENYIVQYCSYFDGNKLKEDSILNHVDQSKLNEYTLNIKNQCNDLKMEIRKQSLIALLGEDHPNLKELLPIFSNESNE